MDEINIRLTDILSLPELAKLLAEKASEQEYCCLTILIPNVLKGVTGPPMIVKNTNDNGRDLVKFIHAAAELLNDKIDAGLLTSQDGTSLE